MGRTERCQTKSKRSSGRRRQLRDQLLYSVLNLLPSLTLRIDQVKVVGAVDFKQVYVFLLIPTSFLLRDNIIAAEIRRDGSVGGALNQPLTRLRNRKLHRIGFAVVIRYGVRRDAQKLDDGIVAQVKFVRLPQVHYASQRDGARYSSLVSGKT